MTNQPIQISFTINGKPVELQVSPSKRLIDILRDDLHLTGTKEGCSIGECGACTVILNDKAVNSCLVMASHLNNAHIQTVESLQKDNQLNELQDNFLKHGAVQCGFCTPGMLMSAKALLDHQPNPTDDEIKTAIEGNLCRCTGYIPIVEAIKSCRKA